jgi:hypothetical protein
MSGANRTGAHRTGGQGGKSSAGGGGGMVIGDAITGGTAGAVLFVGPTGLLAEDPTHFFYDAPTVGGGVGLVLDLTDGAGSGGDLDVSNAHIISLRADADASAQVEIQGNGGIYFDVGVTPVFQLNGITSTITIGAPGWTVAFSGSLGASTFTRSDGVANTVLDAITIERTTTVAATAGIGVGQVFNVENAAGTSTLACRIESTLTTVTAAAEVSTFNVYTLAAGALALAGQFTGATAATRGLYVPSAGRIVLGSTTTAALSLIVTGGNVGYVSTGTATVAGHHFLTGTVATSGSQYIMRVTAAANTGQTASTEAPSVIFNLAATRTYATGALANQRDFQILGSTLAFAGASNVTGTICSLYIDKAPTIGANGTLTTGIRHALWIDADGMRVDGPIYTDQSAALGGGAAPTLGTIGAPGPAAAGQVAWWPVTINGVASFVPYWQ